MNDRITKVILVFIALGLWANAAVTVMRPTPAAADNATDWLKSIDTRLARIEVGLGSIELGACPNQKVC